MEEVKDIPVSWKQAMLSDLFLDPTSHVVDGPFGSNLKASEYQDSGIPVLRIQNIDRNKFIDKNINFVTEEKAEFLKRHSFVSGDIIITKLGMPVGKACFVPKKYDKGIIVADLIRARITHNHIDPKFLVYQINSNSLIKQFEKFTKGTTRPRINLGIVRQLKFNIPPFNEQHRIVSKIDELFSELDNGVSNLKLAQNQLKVYRQALLKHAFEGKLTEQWRKENKPEPAEKLLERIKEERQKRYEQELKDWKTAVKAWEKDGKKLKKPGKPKPLKIFSDKIDQSLRELISVPSFWKLAILGRIVKEVVVGYVGPVSQHITESRDGIRFLSTTHIGENEFLDKDIRLVTKSFSSANQKSLVKSGDIIVARHGDSGKSCIIPDYIEQAQVSNAVIIRPVNEWCYNRYLSHALNYLRTRLQLQKVGGVFQVVNTASMESFPIPICSLNEQHLLVETIDSQFSIVENLEKAIDSGFQKSEALRQSILKKAFEGKLVPQNPNDEPASELLKRILVEKKKYLEGQKQQKKRKPKNVKKMSKELSIEEVLKTSDKPMLAKDVWQKSKHKENIEDFYKELKDIQSKIKEVKKGTESLLNLAK